MRDIEKVDKIIVHCSDSDWGCFDAIDRWHRRKGYDMCGYHYVINNGLPAYDSDYNSKWDGRVEPGRVLEREGAHCREQHNNWLSVGICLIGKHHFTLNQFTQLVKLIHFLRRRFGFLSVHGHREFNRHKTCPNFDVDNLLLCIGEDNGFS